MQGQSACPDAVESAAWKPDLNVMRDAESRPTSIPEGWPVVTPRMVVNGAKELVDFVKQVFHATGEYRSDRPAVLRIGDSTLMISDAGVRDPATAFLYVYVADTEAAYRRALAAGARVLEEPFDTPYGDRRCMVEDRWGNTWQIATPV
jgi:PhnB protein